MAMKKPWLRRKVKVISSCSSLLPDDILIDIISRLVAKDVLQCRCVCRNWRYLTSTQDFEKLFMKRTIPLILVEEGTLLHPFKIFLDKWWEQRQKKVLNLRFYFSPEYHIQFSQYGLLVLKSTRSKEFIVLNPVTRNEVELIAPRKSKVVMFGVFFHPELKEYNILFGLFSKDKSPTKFFIFKLGLNECWKEISNPLCVDYDKLYSQPVSVDNFLYRMVKLGEEDNIIAFDVIKEEFALIAIHDSAKHRELDLNILNIDETVSVVGVSTSETQVNINIWTLKDRATQHWERSDYSIHHTYEKCLCNINLRAIAFVNGELVLKMSYDLGRKPYSRLYVCNLKLATLKNFGKKNYSPNISVFPHVMSLVSLGN